jgi:hypothetical protein
MNGVAIAHKEFELGENVFGIGVDLGVFFGFGDFCEYFIFAGIGFVLEEFVFFFVIVDENFEVGHFVLDEGLFALDGGLEFGFEEDELIVFFL